MSPVPGELGPRRVRVNGAPEFNVIQNPSITRGLQQLLSIKQAHVTPALDEGMQASVLVGDIREDPRSGLPLTFAGTVLHDTDGANPAFRAFINPSDSTRIAVLRRFHAYSTEGAAGPLATYLYYSIHTTQVGTSVSTRSGTRTNFTWNGTGAQPVLPQDPITPAGTPVGWQTTRTNGTNAAYLWRKPWFGTILANGFADEVLENFESTHGPRIVLFPGSAVDFGISDSNGLAYFNMWWDEYPLT